MYLKLTENQFNDSVERSKRFSAATISAAKLVLVDGYNCAMAEREANVLRQTISNAVRVIEKIAVDNNIYSPPGHRWVNACIPDYLADIAEKAAINAETENSESIEK